MTTKLSKIRSQLASLRRRRRFVRFEIGLAALGVALLWALVALFLADWILAMTRLQRVLAMGLAAACVFWAFRHFTRPWLRQYETELDVALFVERQEQIDSDLVAAIQFESPDASQWGSVALEQAVIDRTAASRLLLSPGISRLPLVRRSLLLITTLVLLGVAAWVFPSYMATFLKRLALSVDHYPTQTTIESICINGRELAPTSGSRQTVPIPYGQPVEIEIVCSGRLPDEGKARLKTLVGGAEASFSLTPKKEMPSRFTGRIDRMVASVECRFDLGDAWTDPARFEVVPLPMIEVSFEVTLPDYAVEGDRKTETIPGLRQISVVEGSKVSVEIVSDKRLESARISVGEARYAMIPAPDRPSIERTRWILDAKNTPLASVVKPIHYEIQVTDSDGLQLERAVQGVLRIKADQAPRIACSAVTRYVLPAARPTIAYEATDDFGLARIGLAAKVTRQKGPIEEIDPISVEVLPIKAALDKNRRSRYTFDLTPLGLAKGDRIHVILEATDYRGPKRPGQTTASEPLLFDVTDEQGILAAIAESDRETSQKLQTMIQRQIDIGSNRRGNEP